MSTRVLEFLTTGFVLCISALANPVSSQSPIDSVKTWMTSTLNSGIGESWETEFAWAQEQIAAQPEEAFETLMGYHHLFPSLRSSEVEMPKNTFTQPDRLIWEIAAVQVKLVAANPNLADKGGTPEPGELAQNIGSRDQLPAQLLSAILFVMLLISFALYWRSRQPVDAAHVAASDEYDWLLDALEQNPADEQLIAQFSLLSFTNEQHPIQHQFRHPERWASLNDSEKIVAALMHDGVPTEAIIAELNKNPGTVYNIRSAVRQKLQIPENQDLQQALQEMAR